MEEVKGSNPFRSTKTSLSESDTWVKTCSLDAVNTFAPKGLGRGYRVAGVSPGMEPSMRALEESIEARNKETIQASFEAWRGWHWARF